MLIVPKKMGWFQLAEAILGAIPSPITIRLIREKVTNAEVPGLPEDNQPFLYASGNWGPGYVSVKGMVSLEEKMDLLTLQLAIRIVEILPDLDLLAGNVTGGVIPAWKTHLHLQRVLGHPLQYVYVGGSRNEPGIITIIRKEILAEAVVRMNEAVVSSGIRPDFVAGVTPSGMIPAYQLSQLLNLPFVYIREVKKAGGHKEVITGIKNHPVVKCGSMGLVIGQSENFQASSAYGCKCLTDEGFRAINIHTILERVDDSLLAIIPGVEERFKNGNSLLPVGSIGLDKEELVNFAQTTCNSTEALRQAGLVVKTAATILFYGNPNAVSQLSESGIEMIHLLTLQELLDAAEKLGTHPLENIQGYREFLTNPLGWQAGRGLTRVQGGGTL